jgi:K+ transporter
VVIDMLLTTAFMSLLILTVWRKPWPLALAFLLVFGAIEAVFLSSSVLKVLPASWVLVIRAICGAVAADRLIHIVMRYHFKAAALQLRYMTCRCPGAAGSAC